MSEDDSILLRHVDDVVDTRESSILESSGQQYRILPLGEHILASFFLEGRGARKEENSHSTWSPPHDNAASRPSRSYAALTEHGPNRPRAPQANDAPNGLPKRVAAYARWMEQANKAVQRWKNSKYVERRKTLGTERDLNFAKK